MRKKRSWKKYLFLFALQLTFLLALSFGKQVNAANYTVKVGSQIQLYDSSSYSNTTSRLWYAKAEASKYISYTGNGRYCYVTGLEPGTVTIHCQIIYQIYHPGYYYLGTWMEGYYTPEVADRYWIIEVVKAPDPVKPSEPVKPADPGSGGENPGGSGTGTNPGGSSSVQHRVAFNANGGKVSTAAKTITHNNAIGTLPAATRSYYVFDGWYTSPKGGSEVTASTRCVSNATYYAHWRKLPVPSIKKVTVSGHRVLNVISKIKNQRFADGYQVAYCSKRNMRNAKTAKAKTSWANDFVLMRMKIGKTYYIRMRAYKKDPYSGKRVYGKWSNIKKKKVSAV